VFCGWIIAGNAQIFRTFFIKPHLIDHSSVFSLLHTQQ
jgi:hypothetical protein